MDRFIIHAYLREAGEDGWVWSGCGRSVAEGESSRNWREVNCQTRACQVLVTKWKDQYEKGHNVTINGQCEVCSKVSDAAQKVSPPGATLCGTDFDAWLASPERRRFNLAFAVGKSGATHFADFVRRRQAERANGHAP